ncbi:uroporphyrinogen-III synthase [Thiohalocapsa marina]|uniref:Uroporphyrinogen-III synthase n=1 Tax=Thiohalocapsa marina TaxID=424902 RepID=A0A5M8FID2_9GAMM|nr:uroporphyrinogen-III synthase [Thiohalocapsa marina]KAA6183730.1 uroporphyrinogen-III synthase [Thiohalocapsa marina]
MKTVLVTRTRHQAQPLMTALEQAGLAPILFPTIEISCLNDWAPPDLKRVAGVFFTSVNAVQCLCERLRRDAPAVLAELRQSRVWAVGRATAEALAGYGVGTEPLPTVADAVHLMASIDPGRIIDQDLLFVRGSRSLGTIPSVISERGGRCTELTVYENRKPALADAERIRRLLDSGGIDCLSFTSPSTVEHFFAAMGSHQIPEGVRIAAIGTTTAAALSGLGLRADIMPAVFDGPSLAQAIAEALAPAL